MRVPALIGRMLAAMRTRPANPQTASRAMFVGPNAAGVFVDEDVALNVATVWACIDVISSSLASSEWNVYTGRRGANDQELAPDDALQYVLNTRPNPEMTAKRAKQAMVMAALSWGNGWAEIVRDQAGRVVELWPIEPRRCELRRDIATSRPYLQVVNDFGGGVVELDMRDVLHFAGPGLTGLLGDKPIAHAVRTIALAVAQERYSETYFGNNTQIGGWLESPKEIGDAAYTRLKEQLESGHKGVKRAFQFAIFEGGAKWHPAESDAERAQMVEARHLQIEEICRWFHVPPHKVGHLLRATNNNIEHQGLEFSRETLRPWKIEIEQECDYKLFSARGPRRFVEIDIDWTSEGDFQSRMAGFSAGRAMGVYSVNDILRKLRENTIGPEGDVRTMNGASVKLEDVGKELAAPAASAPGATPPGAPEDPSAVARDWLTHTYARVQRRHDNRAADLRRSGRGAGAEQARADAVAYGAEQVAELADALGPRLALAHEWCARVIDGVRPADAAAEVVKE